MAAVNAAVASGVVRPPSSARLGSHVLEDELAHRQYAVNWNRAVDAANRGVDRRRHARYGTIRGGTIVVRLIGRPRTGAMLAL